MNIVFVCHYFYPEICAPASRVYETAKHWVERGHNITVVTCFPNHPTGVIPKRYKGLKFIEENLEGIRVLRNYVYATPNEGFIKKTLAHVSFMISSIIFSLPKLEKTDVVVVSSPTFFSIFSAYFTSLIKGVPLVLEIRDLWPEAIVKLGILQNKFVIRILEFFEIYFYKKAAIVVVVTQSFKDNLVSRGINDNKIEVVKNGVNLDFFKPLNDEEIFTLKKGFHIDNCNFVVLYAGAHGISHALDKIIETARILKNNKDILFLFVGEGSEKKILLDKAKELGLENVKFIPGQPKELMPAVYGLADVCLVPLRKIDLFKGFIPSKIFEIMACGKPMVASVEGETKDILTEANSALIAEPENSQEIAAAINKLYDNKELRYYLAENGKRFVKRFYSRHDLSLKYLDILKEAVKRGKTI